MVTASDLDEMLARWVRDGLLDAAQAERILAAELAPAPAGAPRPRAASLVAEGLGYVGGVLVLVAAVTIAGRYWSGLGVAGRLGTVAGAAALLFAAGAGAPGGAAGMRLRAVTWAAAVVAVGGTAGLVGEEVLDLAGELVGLLAGVAATAVAVVLWRAHRTPVQQAVVVAAGAFTAGIGAGALPGGDSPVVGTAVWGIGVVWLLLGWGGIAGPERSARVTAHLAGGAAAVLGALLAAGTDAGSGLAVGTVVALVAAGVLTRDLVLLGVGAAATLVLVPLAVGHWFPDTLAAPAALLVVGVLLVAGALVVARRRPAAAAAGDRAGDPRIAVAAAAVVAVAVTVTVLLLGSG